MNAQSAHESGHHQGGIIPTASTTSSLHHKKQQPHRTRRHTTIHKPHRAHKNLALTKWHAVEFSKNGHFHRTPSQAPSGRNPYSPSRTFRPFPVNPTVADPGTTPEIQPPAGTGHHTRHHNPTPQGRTTITTTTVEDSPPIHKTRHTQEFRHTETHPRGKPNKAMDCCHRDSGGAADRARRPVATW